MRFGWYCWLLVRRQGSESRYSSQMNLWRSNWIQPFIHLFNRAHSFRLLACWLDIRWPYYTTLLLVVLASRSRLFFQESPFSRFEISRPLLKNEKNQVGASHIFICYVIASQFENRKNSGGYRVSETFGGLINKFYSSCHHHVKFFIWWNHFSWLLAF